MSNWKHLLSSLLASLVMLWFVPVMADAQQSSKDEPAASKPSNQETSKQSRSEQRDSEQRDSDQGGDQPLSGDGATSDEAAGTALIEDGEEPDVLEGHSYHGEVFNEGPRQAAYLMGGTGDVDFPVTTRDEVAQQFINQGVGQLHGFWDFEAERSFRQAAAIDPDCAMAYWGAALANRRNQKRASGFIAEAVERKEHVTRRERLYIDALAAYHREGKADKKARSKAYVDALETIIAENPEDLEAKAFLAVELYRFRSSLPITSYFAVDSLIQQVLAVKPLHSVHHFRIHLWDRKRPAEALSSAARCGQGSPAIAHMWHMPGHIYSKLKRYNDAAWQQEASARVDHAHMMRDRVMPDRIHNFAHNNEWLIRNLIHVGRVRDAVDLAKNMIELPRHPKFNSLKKRGSTYYGRIRLWEVLTKYELWEELISLTHSPYLDPTESATRQRKRLRLLGMAHYRSGDIAAGDRILEQLDAQIAELRREQDEAQAKDKSSSDAKSNDKSGEREKSKVDNEGADGDSEATNQSNESNEAKNGNSSSRSSRSAESKALAAKIRSLERTQKTLKGYQAVARKDYREGITLLSKGEEVDPCFLARVRHLSGDTSRAVRDLRRQVKTRQQEVLPLAHLADILWQSEQESEAVKTFRQLRNTSWSIEVGASPVFARLAPLAQHLNLPDDWRRDQDAADDVGDRPDLDSLGPFRWHPSPAPKWTLADAEKNEVRLEDYRGEPLLLIFYLGFGCLHCAQQLQAFGPAADDFDDHGISMLAISSDDHAGLKISIENYGSEMPIRLVADPKLDVFKAYRVYDDFEGQPLHGTFLIDEDGLVLWQDISYEPFMDPKFVLQEATRLLKSSPSATPIRSVETSSGGR